MVSGSGGRDRWSEMEEFIAAELGAGTFPGASLIVSRKDKVLFQKQWGTFCRLKDRAALLDRSVLHPLYSFSKLISATVIMMIVQDGQIELDRPMKEYLPEFAGDGREKITLRHLLTHSAGIPSVPLGPVRNREEWDAGLKTICAARPEWEPGTKTFYHALTGQFVAAAAVLRVTRAPSWEALCRERLFAPLGAGSLTFALPSDTAPVAITPQPADLPKTLGETFTLAGHPAGGCFGTVEDALKVLRLHLKRGKWGRQQILSEKTLNEMHTVQYGREIAQAVAAGQPPAHDPWGLGPLMRGEFPKSGSHDWFGFRDQASPGIFGHAGIDTVIGVADPATEVALFFVTTHSPKPPEKTVPLRNGVTNRVFAALKL
jgi:CubicO group peptidase (beta-lactamase class C family)